MTVNICWLSHTSTGEAVSLITDSRLSGGIRFDECKKIFSLPRGDCLISFSGTTDIAYTLINQAISNVATNKQSMSRYQDITDLKGSLLYEISSLVEKIHLPFPEDDGNLKDIELILAGYSWKFDKFYAWRIRSCAKDRPSHTVQNIKEGLTNYYHPDPLVSKFVTDKNYFNKRHLIVTGTKEEAKAIEGELMKRKREKSLAEWGNEPIMVLEEVLQKAHKNRDLNTTSAGPMQYMRVFKHASTELDAVLWPDDEGYWKPTISGRFLTPSENFDAPLYDPRKYRVIQVPYNKNSLENKRDFYDSIQ